MCLPTNFNVSLPQVPIVGQGEPPLPAAVGQVGQLSGRPVFQGPSLGLRQRFAPEAGAIIEREIDLSRAMPLVAEPPSAIDASTLETKVSSVEAQRFLLLNCQAAQDVLEANGNPGTREATQAAEQLTRITADIQDHPVHTAGGLGATIKTQFKAIKKALATSGIGKAGKALIQALQKVLVRANPEWREGYGITTQTGKTIRYQPSGPEPATCHDATTAHPTNAWAVAVEDPDGRIVDGSRFHRHGTFAPQPSKAGEKWNHIQKQGVANQRAAAMAKSMIADHIRRNPSVSDRFDFCLANLNLMRQGMIVNEKSLNDIHAAALHALDGQTLTIEDEGRQYTVRVTTREWRQDIKDAPYYGNSREANRANDAALHSLQDELNGLRGTVPPEEFAEMQAMTARLGTQLTLQQHSALRRLMDFTKWGKRMDPCEVSALVINLESMLARYRPGGVSEGCKSGKDRGSLVDVAAKALALERDARKAAGHRGAAVIADIRPDWMLQRARTDETFRHELADLFKANLKLQALNTGLKGYITRDIFSGLGHENYMERLARHCLGDIRGGSAFVQT